MDRKANPYTQLMVDEAILDFLIYTAIGSLLECSHEPVPSADSAVQMVAGEKRSKFQGLKLSAERNR